MNFTDEEHEKLGDLFSMMSKVGNYIMKVEEENEKLRTLLLSYLTGDQITAWLESFIEEGGPR